jgi:hypothetical protein
MPRRRKINLNVPEVELTREEELKLLDEFIEKNGVKVLPPDERGPEAQIISPWTRSKKKK